MGVWIANRSLPIWSIPRVVQRPNSHPTNKTNHYNQEREEELGLDVGMLLVGKETETTLHFIILLGPRKLPFVKVGFGRTLTN